MRQSGTDATTGATRQPISEDEWQHFIGPGAAYYRNQFSKLDALHAPSGPMTPPKTSLALATSNHGIMLASAFLSPAVFFFYRKMYAYAFATLLAIGVYILIQPIRQFRDGFFIMLAGGMVGLQANRLYYHFATKKILALRQRHGHQDEYPTILAAKGGRNRIAALGYVLLVLVLGGVLGSRYVYDARPLAEADAAFTEKDFQKTIRLCDAMLQKDSRRVPAYMLRGKAFMQIHRFEQSLADFTIALSIEPANIPARTLRGLALIATGQPQEALAELDQVVAKQPNSALAHFSRALALAASGRFKPALEAVDNAIRLDPKKPEYQALRRQLQDALDQPPGNDGNKERGIS